MWYFYLGKISEHIFPHDCQLTICSITPEKPTEPLRSGVKSLGKWKKRESFLFLSVIPWMNAILHVRAPWAECEDTHSAKTLFGTKRMHFPGLLCWRSAQSLLAFAGFIQLLHFEAARTFSVRERLTGKSRHVLPTELQYRLTWSMQSRSWRQNQTKMRFIKAQISMQLQRGAHWLISLWERWLCSHSY